MRRRISPPPGIGPLRGHPAGTLALRSPRGRSAPPRRARADRARFSPRTYPRTPPRGPRPINSISRAPGAGEARRSHLLHPTTEEPLPEAPAHLPTARRSHLGPTLASPGPHPESLGQVHPITSSLPYRPPTTPSSHLQPTLAPRAPV